MLDLKRLFNASLLGFLCVAPVLLWAADDKYASIPFADTLWSINVAGVIASQQLTYTGDVLVASDSVLALIDGASGNTKWIHDDTTWYIQDVPQIIPWTPYVALNVIVVDSVVYKQEKMRSSEGWATEGTKLVPEMYGRTQIKILDMDANQFRWSSADEGFVFASGFILLPQMNGVLFIGIDTIADSTVYSLSLMDLKTWKPLWKNTALYNEKHFPMASYLSNLEQSSTIDINQYPVWLPDSSFLELLSKNGLHKIDAKTGKLLWTSPLKIKTVPTVSHGSEWAQMFLSGDSQAVYVPHEKELYKISVKDGSLIWQKPAKLWRNINQMEEHRLGIIARTSGYDDRGKAYSRLHVIDADSGTIRWKTAMGYKEDSPFVVEKDSVYWMSGNSLKKYSLDDGECRTLVDKIDFEGGQTPQKIVFSDKGIVMQSDNNLKKFRWNGTPAFHAYYEAPQKYSGWAKAGLIALNIVASTALSVAIGPIASYDISGGTQYWYLAPSLLDYSSLHERYKASEASKNDLYILTNVFGGGNANSEQTGIAIIDKDTGKLIKRVQLKTKTPQYCIDPISKRLFFVSEKNRVVCFNLQ